MSHISVFDVLIAIFFIRFGVNSLELQYIPQRHRDHAFSSGVDHWESLTWVVKLNMPTGDLGDSNAADAVATDTGLLNQGQISNLDRYYVFSHPSGVGVKHASVSSSTFHDGLSTLSEDEHSQIKDRVHQMLDRDPFVEWYMLQRVVPRFKRMTALMPEDKKLISSPSAVHFNDPFYHKQWHLINTRRPGMDINITGVWRQNITGHGVTVAVIDDGLEWTNVDLSANYNPAGSFDLNSGDDDPMPDWSKGTNHHGTRCAGEIAAVADNHVCGVGVAHGARVSGIRILDGLMTDLLEASAFMNKYDVNDVYSCSWGPKDDGRTVDGPQHVTVDGMRHGVEFGRRGYGSIYVVASGNGGIVGDNCNYDGYANTIYTVTIGAVGEDGAMPFYGEECASMLAVTFSSSTYHRSIVTTDWTKSGGTGCTESHSGTSAAAPVAAALIALMLEARPCLTWRDIQHIIVFTAVKVDERNALWMRNKAGLSHSHQHGFGLMNAWRMVSVAKVWRSVPWMTVYTSETINVNKAIPSRQQISSSVDVTDETLAGYGLETLEYVHACVSLTHERRGDVELVLVCPSGTTSVIGATRSLDNSTDGFKQWIFSTVRCWGETPTGTWKLLVTDKGSNTSRSRGVLEKWVLKLFGSPMTTDEVQERIRLVADAAGGKYIEPVPCSPPPQQRKMDQELSEKVLKIVALTSVFALILALYDTFEYACCYDDEKRKTIREWLLSRIWNETGDNGNRTSTVTGDAFPTSDSATELTALLSAEERLLQAEEIALDTFSASSVTPPTADALLTAEYVTQLIDDDDDDVIIELERQQQQLS